MECELLNELASKVALTSADNFKTDWLEFLVTEKL